MRETPRSGSSAAACTGGSAVDVGGPEVASHGVPHRVDRVDPLAVFAEVWDVQLDVHPLDPDQRFRPRPSHQVNQRRSWSAYRMCVYPMYRTR